MPSSRLLFVSVCAVLAAGVSVDASAQVRTYDNPQHEGLALSYCGANSSSCGEYMATAWCLSIGYEFASDWAARAGIDQSIRTIRLDDGAICEGAACEAFARITCGPESRTFTTPVLGPAGKLTLLSSDRRSITQSIDAAEYRVMVPGCSQREPGVFVCESIDEYEHCRTLMISRMIHSCRVEMPLRDVIAEPRAVTADEYELSVESDAVIRVRPGERGRGQTRGNAEVVVRFDSPATAPGSECVGRRPYVYYPTGPEGGRPGIGKADACDAPMELRLEAHEDDLLRAYDLCETFASWGFEIEDSMEVLIAGLFELRSTGASPSIRVVAPHSMVSAPLKIECGV